MENYLLNSNDDELETIKNDLIEFGFLKENIDLVLKITSGKQEAIEL